MAGPGSGERQGEDEDLKFPTKQLFILAICRLAEPIAFTSIMSYTYIMVKEFPEGSEDNAATLAGLLVSAFAVSEALTAMWWGTISDSWGRKPVILTGLAGTALSSIIFGFATNFWVALGARMVGGLLNGNVAVMQTAVAEICKKSAWEPRAYAMIPFVWSLGTIVGAAMGGFLAQPARYYPSLFASDGIFGKYPYLLPNLIAAIFIFIAIGQGYLFLEETNVRFASESPLNSQAVEEHAPLISNRRRRSTADILSVGNRKPSFISGSMPTMSEPSFDLRKGSVTTMHDIKSVVQAEVFHPEDIEEGDAENISDPPLRAFNRNVILWIIALVVVCFHQMSFGSLIPIYLLDDPVPSKSIDLVGGLGYTVHDVGTFMSINGLVAMLIQGFIFPPFVSKFGVWRSITVFLIASPLTYILVPFLSLLQNSTTPESSHSGIALPAGIYAILTLFNFIMIILYPCLLIALKNATPSPLVLGKVNGLAMSACSGARTIAPPLVGIIYGKGGSAMAWWSVAGVAVLGIMELAWLVRPKEGANVTVENVLRESSAADELGDGVGREVEEEI